MGLDKINFLAWSPLVYILSGVAAGGIFLLFYGIGQGIWKKRRRQAVFLQDQRETDLWSKIMEHKKIKGFKDYVEERTLYAGVKWSFKEFILYSLLLGISGGGIAIKYLNNLPAALPLGVGGLLISWLYVNFFVVRKEALLERQFIPMIQHFISEYSSLSNITAALTNILVKLDNPLKEEVTHLINDLNSGCNTEEAFFSFAERLNSQRAFRFAHILNLRVNKGIPINVMLFNLYMDMKTKVVKEKERNMESIGVRMESYMLYAAIPMMYLLASKINPKSHYLLTQTPEGKKMMLYIVTFLVVGIISTISISNNKIK